MVDGWERGLVAHQGLLAHGRGEAFDYLLGERTTSPARRATRLAARVLRAARHPVISVNGNLAALVPEELVALAAAIPAPLEINLFHRSEARIARIARALRSHGASIVYGQGADARVPGLRSPRGRVHRAGIGTADVVLVGLEDGDRTEKLRRQGVLVIAVDLNPLSRTARRAHLTIVDNATRAYAALVEAVRTIPRRQAGGPRRVLIGWDNQASLAASASVIRRVAAGLV